MRVVPASLVLCLGVMLASCAQDVDDIDRTQPNLLPKAMFRDHAWFVRQTVTDVPPTSEFSFVGETGTLEIVHWEIQQEYLVGYRAYEKVPGSESDADHSQGGGGAQPVREGRGSGRDPGLFKGNPIVAYPIVDHADVIRDYNPRTGEQTNVIREDNVDRPWHERAYVRVDWSKNLVANFDFISTAVSIEPTNSGYVEENEGGPDAFARHTDKKGEVDYFDFTERLFVEPEDRGCILSMNYRLGDCAGDEIKVRTSFLRVDEAREADYVPLDWDDLRQGEFGYFRIERPTYDRRRGLTWSGTQQLVTRHDMWQGSRDEDGNALPYAQRGLRPLVYSLSKDYPEELKPITFALAGEWDQALKGAAAAARGQTIEQLDDDLRAETGDSCMFCVDENLDGHARIGDLRYNFIYWVDHPQPAGPLGYGPSSPNPETGRIVAGMAYVYGASVDTQSQEAQDIVDLLNGEYTPDDFLEADFVREQVLSRRPVLASDSDTARALEALELSAEPGRLLTTGQRTRLETIRKSGLPAAKPGYDKARLSLIRGTPFERMLINDEVILGRGQGLYRPGETLSDDAVAQLSPVSWGTIDARKDAAKRREKASQHCVWLKEFSDPSVIGLAKATRDAELSGDRLWQALREDIFEGVMEHEIGHTLGLRHNFSGSADALNFHPEYWPLREQTIISGARTVNDLLSMSCEREDASNRNGCAAQRDGRMSEFQYSTVMDYGAKFNSDIHGLGHYDHAAIAAGYGDLIEVFDAEVADGMNANDRELVDLVGDIRVPLQGSLTEFTHYSTLPQMFGGREALERRSYLPRSHYLAQRERGEAPLRVPYIACYEEYVDATPYCHRWDAGADPYEISMHYVNTYREYYPLVNFQRDRVTFSPSAVGDRMTDRFFLPLANMYQQWLLSSFGGGSGDALLETYSELGMLRGFSLLWEVMSTPRYGSYRLRPDPSGTGELYTWQSYSKLDGAYYVPPGVGRRQFSRYDISAGFNFYQRVLESGSFYEQIGALLALTASDASVLGIGADIDADSLAYSIPYYIVFQEEIDSLFSGIISEDFQSYAPYVQDEQVVRKDLWLEDITPPPATAPRLEVTVPWSTQLYTMLYGMSMLSANFDTSFLTKAQVAMKGEGEPIAPAAGFTVVEGTDPISGRVYQAYRDPVHSTESFVAARLVERLQRHAADYAGAAADSRDQIIARSEVQNDVQLLEILRSLYGQFNSVLPVTFVSSSDE
jgi:Met-zincin